LSDACDIEVQDTPTVVTDDEKAIARAEGDRRNREEVHRGNRFTSIAPLRIGTSFSRLAATPVRTTFVY